MQFSSEKEMNPEVRKFLSDRVLSVLNENETYGLLKSDKGFDIPIYKDGDDPKLFFLELKCYKQSDNRLGVGHGKGGGFQVEVLQLLPDYFETYLKWLLAYLEMHPDKYLLLNTSDIKKNVSGGDVGKKFNNIRLSVFRDYTLLDEDELVSELIAWLQSYV